MQPHEELVEAIAQEIEQHFAQNPGASDSAEGIRAFWLPPVLRALPLELVIEALEQLEAEGVVKKIPIGTGFVYEAAPGTVH
jgi:hypothetical protein